MATLHLRNVPDNVVERLKERAATRRHSLNAEAVAVLSASAVERRSIDEVLDAIRRNAAVLKLGPGDLDAAELLREGRDERTSRVLGSPRPRSKR